MSRLIRLLTVVSLIMLGSFGNCRAEVILKKQVLGDKEIYILENEYLRLVINPSLGGRGESLLYKKTGKDLTLSVSPVQAPAGSGLFLERFWGAKQIREFEKLPYKIESKDITPDLVSIKLTNLYHNLKVQKTITIKKGCSSVQIDYCITNEGDKDYIGRLWVVNSIFPGGSPKRLTFFYPYGKFSPVYTSTLTGNKQITRISYIPGKKPANANNWINDPVRAWGAVASEDKIGAAFEIEYPYFERFYSYHPSPGKSEPIPTFEWLYSPMKLPPLAKGKEEAILHPELTDPLKAYIFRTGWKLIPFSGLPTVDGVAEGIVGSIVIDEKSVKVGLVSDRNRDLEIILSRYRLPLEKEEVLDKRKINLSTDETETFSLPITHKDKGTYVYKLTLKSGKGQRKIVVFEVPYIYKEPSLQYVLKPEEEKSHLFDPGVEISPLGTDIPAPCIKWAKPLDKPVKTLIVAPVSSHREIAELVRRVDIDLTLVEVDHPHCFRGTTWYSWKVPDPAKTLKKALEEDYEVIILAGSLFWSRVPEELRKEILKKVQQGTGLIYIHPVQLEGTLKKLYRSPSIKPDTDFITSGIPYSVIPGLKESNPFSKVYSLHQYGKGRVIFIHYNPTPGGYYWRSDRSLTPVVNDDSGYFFPYWEYYYSFLAKSILFASQKEPDLLFSELRFQKNKNSLLLKIDNHRKKEKVNLFLEVFNRKWEKVEEKNIQIELFPGSNEINLPVRILNLSGVHFFDVILKKGGKVLNWATSWTNIINPVRLVEVRLNKFAHSQKDPISGRFVVESDAGERLDAYTLHYWITDVHQRLLMEKIKKLTAGKKKGDKITINFKENLTIPSLSTLCWLEVELLNKNRIVDYQRKYFTVKLPQEKDINFTIWGISEGNHWTQRLMLKRLREIGFEWATGMHLTSMNKEETRAVGRNVLAADLEFLPMTLHRLISKNLKGVIRIPCLTDPVYLEKMKNDVKKGGDWTKAFFPPAYFVSDENSLGRYSAPHDFCQSPTCLKRFRTYLKKKYNSVEILNNIWHTSFKKWDDVFPYTLSQAKKKDNFVPWAEHRLFMFQIFAEAIGNEKRFLQEVDPEGKLAVSGMGVPNVYNGFDWYLLSRHLDYIVAYTGWSGVVDMLRSFRKEGALLGSWNGYGSTAESIRNKIWHEAINQFFNPGYWWQGYLLNHGDYTISEAGKDFKEIIAEVKGSGIGKIFVEAEWIPSDIAIHQSTPSLVASNVTGNYNFLNETVFQSNLTGWVNLVRDMGFQPPTFLSSYQIEEGILSPEKYPIFVLPLSQALSNKEINEIIAYVKEGGILIADTRPGIFLENSYPRKRNPLNEVFGISRSSGKVEKIKSCIYLSEDGKKERLPLSPLEKSLKLKGGEALGFAAGKSKTKTVQFGKLSVRTKTGKVSFIPALIINKYGKGYGIYLNFILSEYPDLRKRGLSSKIVVEALRKTLEKTNFQPAVKVNLPPGSEMVRYKDDENLYLCLWRGLDFTKEENRVKIVLPEKKNIYEVKTHKYLGRSDTILTTLFPGEVKIFAILPYKRKAINIDAKLTPSGQISYRINLVNTLGKKSAGIVRLEVYSEGKLKEWYTKNLKVSGVYKSKIPLALNERKGKWKLKVIDIITGREYEKEIQFKM